MAARWWNDCEYKLDLESRCAAGGWYVHAPALHVVGEAQRIIYAGYRVELPDSTTTILNPDKTDVVDVSYEEYLSVSEEWRHRSEESQWLKEEEEAEANALLIRQRECLHQQHTTAIVIEVAGCDIYDTQCDICGVILRRSWSTAYDKDPDDHIYDWNWWVREHERLYNETPRLENYRVLERIERIV